ncbi:MAG: GlxA family transcriptional regulator [Rhizobiales bacterium]|nr:GlxA family transcriptional regulator [Hyphomicrobiales bacterium]
MIVSAMLIRRHDVVFLLIPRFSMIALFSALEPLRVANRFAGEIFSWRFVSVDGQGVAASNGIPVSVSSGLEGVGKPDLLVVCASYEHEAGMVQPVLNEIRRVGRNGSLLAAVDTGAFLLAEAGVLNGYRATCHWETLPAFRESYPNIDVAETTYVLDRGRMTASGGANALDMMLDWLAAIEGEALAAKVADTLVHTRHLNHPGEARIPAGSRYRVSEPRVLAAIRLMEEHIEDVLTMHDIARGAGASERHLERLFRSHLSVTPKTFYSQLRLERAERLLTYSRMSVRDVSLACGFSSLALFSRAFKARFGRAPSLIRQPATS